MKMIPMCDGHICLMKTRRDGTVICSKDFKSSGRYADASHLYVVVKDEMGNPLISIPFRDIAAGGI